MKRHLICWLAVAICTAGARTAARGQDTPDTPEQIQQWIQDLDSPQFSKRRSASQELTRAGEAAIDALKRAAASDSRERSIRSLEILEKHWQGANDTLKDAARKALDELKTSDNPTLARRAEAILNPKPEAPPPQVPQALIPLQIQVQGGIANGVRTIQVQNINGVKRTTVQDKNRKITIEEDPNQGIKIEVTEAKDGKSETKKYEAKDAAELKKKHPEAHKIYEEFSNQQPLQIRIGALPLQIPPPGPPAADIIEQVKKVERELDQLEQSLKSLRREDNQPQWNETMDRLEKARKALEELKK
jgi:uncharacterized protein Yka (UPF0111/DUF47 family)